MIHEKWEAMPMLGSPLWGVKDSDANVIVLGLTEANARLIAAAPETKKQRDDLLEMCKEAQKAVYLAINGNKKILSHIWNDLKQAITKAE